jgi:hypothetical protein
MPCGIGLTCDQVAQISAQLGLGALQCKHA